MIEALALLSLTLLGLGTSAIAWHLRRRYRQTIVQLQASNEELRNERCVMQQSIENMGVGISAFDHEGRLLLFNTGFVELLELPLEVLERKSLQAILEFQIERGDFGPGPDSVSLGERVARVYQNLPAVKERITAAGRTLQIRRHAMPEGVVSLYSDITQIKAAELRISHARDEAESANRAKSEFLANMSHELRTPLNAIVGFSEIISGEVLGPMADKRYLDYVRDIHASGLHLLSIINDVLDMAKVEAGKLDLEHVRVNITQVMRDALLMVREQAQRRKIELAVTVRPDELSFMGDERALKQALVNIVSNAVKFSHDGGRVDIRATSDVQGGVTLEVEDQGIGMSKEAMERVLRPFEQADSSTTRSHGGTGLGLPIAKSLAEALGGMLTLESCKGEGTRVRILLPVQSGVGMERESSAAQGLALTQERLAAVALTGKT